MVNAVLIFYFTLVSPIFGDFDSSMIYEELDNTLETAQSSTIPLSVQLANKFRLHETKKSSESSVGDEAEPPDSDTVHLLIHNDFKQFLKTMPVMTLRMLKNLTLADPEAGHRLLLKLAKERKEKKNEHNRPGGYHDCIRKIEDCEKSYFDGLLHESQVRRPVPTESATENPRENFYFQNLPEPFLISVTPGPSKMRKFKLQFRNKKPVTTSMFKPSPFSGGYFEPSFPPRQRRPGPSRVPFPFISHFNENQPETDIITYQNERTFFQDHIPSGSENYQYPSSNYQNVHTQGSMGPYSWTIEPASLEKIQSETFIPPSAIFQAIAHAEQDNLNNQKENVKRDRFQVSQDVIHYPNQGAAADSPSQVQERLRHTSQNPKPGSVPMSSQKYASYSPYFQSPNSDTVASYNGPSYTQTYTLPGSQYFPVQDQSYKHSRNPGSSYITDSDYLPGPGPFQIHNSNNLKSGAEYYTGQITDWMAQAKSAFGTLVKSSYNTQATTRKVLEITIGILAFLAFGGYVATLLFRNLVSGFSLPIYSETTNSTTTINPGSGLLGLFLGRSLFPNQFLMEEPLLNKLEQMIKVAVAKGQGRFMEDTATKG